MKLNRAKLAAINSGNLTKKLDLYNLKLNQIESDTFQGLNQLTDLNLYENELNEIDPNLFQHDDLKSLENIWFGNNNLKILNQAAFSRLDNLIRLDLARNVSLHFSEYNQRI